MDSEGTNKAKLFISYSADDTHAKYVGVIVDYLNEIAKEKKINIEVLFDKNLTAGSDLNKFMQQIEKNVDLVLVICSPSYKLKSEGKKGDANGVYTETQLIKKRLKQLEATEDDLADNKEKSFFVVPIILNISKDALRHTADSVPDYISGLINEKVNPMFIESEKKGGIAISEDSKKEYKEMFTQIILKTCFAANWRYKQNRRRYLETRKEEYAPLNADSTAFVRTFFYDNMENNKAYFLIGRKGSGKTTLRMQMYRRNAREYYDEMKLLFDKISLDTVYHYIYFGPSDGNDNISSDFGNIIQYEKIYEFIWTIYTYLYAMYILTKERKKKNSTFDSKQKRKLFPIVQYMELVLEKRDKSIRWEDDDSITDILFNFSLSNVYKYFVNCYKSFRADDTYAASDIATYFNRGQLLVSIFGKKIIDVFYVFLNNSERKFLFTLDGFDFATGIFRQKSKSESEKDKKQRADFETGLISSLMELVLEYKENPQNKFYNHIDICFSIPKDLFIEILNINRDKYKFSGHFCEAGWTGIELANMIRKRLEIIKDCGLSDADKKGKSVEQILGKVLQQYSDIPKEMIIITPKGHTYNIDFFLYLLRYSFWRPRDIIHHYCSIMDQLIDHCRTGVVLDVDTIKEIVSCTSASIVNSDFYNEFSSLWPDIRNGIARFRNKNLVMSVNELKDIIGDSFQIRLAVDEDKSVFRSFKKKVALLYEIGFLGIMVSAKYKKEYHMVTDQGFIFSEGMQCLNGFFSNRFDEGCQFVINPVFISDLHLIINTESFIGVNNWNDLHKLENKTIAKITSDWGSPFIDDNAE